MSQTKTSLLSSARTLFSRSIDNLNNAALLPLPNIWFTAKSLSEYQGLIEEFLDRKRYATLWHAGPIENETDELVPVLKHINSLGLIPINSQPGVIQFWGKQRPYLEAITDELTAKLVLEGLQDHPNVKVFIQQNREKLPKHIKSSWPVTSSHEIKWKTYAPTEAVHSCMEYMWSPRYSKTTWNMLNDAYTVFIYDTRWNNKTMWKNIIDALETNVPQNNLSGGHS